MLDGSNTLIFIGGIHGSGKTTIGKAAALRLGADFRSCSQIIRFERQTQAVSTPGVTEVDVNQLALITGLKRLRGLSITVILDGHFTLITQNDGIQNIPISVFEAMLPDVLFLVETRPSSVCSRLASRDGVVTHEAEILGYQEHERQFASHVSRKIGRQLIVLNGDDDNAHLAVMRAVR